MHLEDKYCEVVVLNRELFGKPKICGRVAAYLAKGCLGAVTGKAFVCEEHKNHYAPRELVPIDDWWMKQTEAILRG